MNDEEKIDLVNYRFTKAKETLREFDIQVANELWTAAVNRLYYACFYAVSALLIDKSILVKTHSGVRQMLGLHFIATSIIYNDLGRFYTHIFDMRHTGDYDDYIYFDKEDVIAMIEPATKLINRIGELLYSQ